MSMIEISNLTFAYDGSYENVFTGVSFRIDTDWRLGFTGRNGRGKTTFLRLLMGHYPYQGRITASVGFTYFPQAVREPERLTVEILDQLCPGYAYWRLAREMHLLQLDESVLYRPYGSLSGGEQTKLQLALLFQGENQFLLIDEPTNHLDIRGRELVARYLRGKKGFILVSHDRSFLDQCVDHILSINKANIQVQAGNFSTWYANKRLQDQFEQAENEKLRREIGRLEEAARQKAQWSVRHEADKTGAYDKGFIGAEAARMMKRSKAIQARQQAAIEEKSKLLKNIDRADSLKIFQAQYHRDQLLRLEQVTVDYGQGPVCRDISFSVHRGQRLALTGPNGCGKSSLLKLIAGEPIPHTGLVKPGTGVTVSYVPQDDTGISGSIANYAQDQGVEESLFNAMLQKLGFTKEHFARDIRQLSQGQRKKVLIARSLCQSAHLHIWDEPMNYIDVISRIQLEELLLEFKPTLLLVEHDKTFCDNIATDCICL